MSDFLQPHRLYSLWNSPGQDTGVGSLSLLQGTFPTQGSNPGLPHCRQILYQLSHKGSPRILEWIAYPSPVDPPNPGIEQGSPALQVSSLPTELSGKRLLKSNFKNQIVSPIVSGIWMMANITYRSRHSISLWGCFCFGLVLVFCCWGFCFVES